MARGRLAPPTVGSPLARTAVKTIFTASARKSSRSLSFRLGPNLYPPTLLPPPPRRRLPPHIMFACLVASCLPHPVLLMCAPTSVSSNYLAHPLWAPVSPSSMATRFLRRPGSPNLAPMSLLLWGVVTLVGNASFNRGSPPVLPCSTPPSAYPLLALVVPPLWKLDMLLCLSSFLTVQALLGNLLAPS